LEKHVCAAKNKKFSCEDHILRGTYKKRRYLKLRGKNKNYLLENHDHFLAFEAKLFFLLLDEKHVISMIMRPSDLITND
jgi:hypothetical protein